jgi:glycosyltransferase involved in cell wall biosynthesis
MKVSIVTVCFNAAEHIATALESISAQQGVDLEHLVLDGASTDGTQEIVRRHAEPWRTLVSEPDRGIYDAMNKGLARATGDIIGTLNADDFFAGPDTLATVLRAFEAEPHLEAVWGDLCYVRRDDTSEVVRYWKSSDFQPGSFARGWAPPHPTFYVRRGLYERFGGFDMRYSIAADVELMMRFLEVGKPRSRHLPEVLVRMRMGGTTNKSVRNVWRQNVEIWHALGRHNLHPNLAGYVGGKLLSRGGQFMKRPQA